MESKMREKEIDLNEILKFLIRNPTIEPKTIEKKINPSEFPLKSIKIHNPKDKIEQ